MSMSLFLPALVAAGAGVAAGLVRWPVKPTVALRLLSAVAALSASTMLAVVSAVALGFAGRPARVMALIERCPAIPLHHEVGSLEGSLALLLVVVVAARLHRVMRRRARAVAGTEGRRLSVLQTMEPIAFAAPGKPGCVVVSQGLLDALDPSERQVLFAHERAHLDQRHDRYLLAGELAVAVLPMLRPLASQIRLATERCADEAAVDAVQGDRVLVASAIARAAIRTTSYYGLVAGFGGGSVSARMKALLGPPPSVAMGWLGIAFSSFALISVTAAGSIQVHHLATLINHLCHQ